MRLRGYRFRKLGSKLILLLAGLIAAVQVLVFILISRVNEHSALAHINQNLRVSARVFRGNIDERVVYLTGAAKAMSGDYAIRLLLMQEPLDPQTLRSNLLSYADRVQAPLLTLFSETGERLASTDDSLTQGDLAPFEQLITSANKDELEQASDFAYIQGNLHVIVVVPVYAPFPSIAAWFGIAYPIDKAFAQSIKNATLADVTFTSRPAGQVPRVLSTTLSTDRLEDLSDYIASHTDIHGKTVTVRINGEEYVTLFEPLQIGGALGVTGALQRSLSAELAPARELEEFILIISISAIFVATLIALFIARGVSQPLNLLTQHANSVAYGDYDKHLQLDRVDELGQLAMAFNKMTDGLADRDRVRDLLGKVVSPEIAAKLINSGVALGGEEREVTIMFCDLRDFTSISEKLSAIEVLTMLNRYLDRMSTIIEKHGGVIDKYIGDAIMALFGAPISMPDAAARAVAAAREMADAVSDMNRELQREGRPALGFGIGINTATVVAGNMGSKTRLNYTVVGDGVNLAARLETLTKNRSFDTSIVISESTAKNSGQFSQLRSLGQVTVKGKTEPIKIYSVDVRPRPWDKRAQDADLL